MRIGFIVFLFTTLVSSIAAPDALHADTLDGTLNHMDQAGAQFKAMEANFKYTKFTAIINEGSDSTGSIKIKRPKAGKLLALFDFVAPDKKVVVVDDQKVDIYLPNIKTVQEADLCKHKVLVEQFFLFGFGTSRSDLEASYSVSLGGNETVNGEPTTRLMLVSKNPDIQKQLTRFELWISDKTGQPVQQKFYEPSGDYNVFIYSNMKINPNLPDTALRYQAKNFKKEILNR